MIPIVSDLVSFLKSLSEPMLVLLIVSLLVAGVFAGTALLTRGTPWERLKAGYKNAFLRIPHSLIAFCFTVALTLGFITGEGVAQSQSIVSDPDTLPVLLPGLLVLLLVVYVSIRAARGG